MFFQVAGEKPTVQPEVIFNIGNFPITNSMITAVLVSIILIIFIFFVRKNYKFAGLTNKLQTLAELAVDGFINLISQITGNRERAKELLPLIGALFLFLGLSNLITLIPFFSCFTYDGLPLFRTPSNDFNLTFSLAFSMVLLTNLASLKKFGFFGHLGKFFKFKGIYLGFKQGIGPGVMACVDFLIGLLDIISEVAKIISLSLRLFGNMYAGDVLLVILFGAFALFVPNLWVAMSLLAAVLQALVFGSLTAAYYTLAVESSEE
ncbi:MAG: FoF1 ATP synthase subunit a [Patescibacteria group bacterium]